MGGLLSVMAIVATPVPLQSPRPSIASTTPSRPAGDEQRIVMMIGGVVDGQSTTTEPAPEPRWGRAEVTWDPEHYPTNRSDWADMPAEWALRSVTAVPDIPAALHEELARLDCVIPRFRRGTEETSVIRGEFERRGQQDLAILCVHADRTSSVYMFWGGDPARREVMPQSGSSITTMRSAAVEDRVDLARPLEPDMPATVDHDAIDIGCCECCSAIFYRHGGKWFTLPGSD
jgi:hypothetical protein